MSPKKNLTVAIQVPAISFFDEGVEPLLDQFQEKVGINTLFLSTQTFDRGTGGRQIQGYPLPDHGVQEYDQEFQGGSFATVHEEFYRNTFINDFRAPVYDSQGADILEMVIEPAKKRDIAVFSWVYENPYARIARHISNFVHVSEVDPWGRLTGTPCFNNPAYRNWYLSIIEDQIKSYDLDGIIFGSERQGPLSNLVGGGFNTRGIGCFCPYCCEIMHRNGLDSVRAREAYARLSTYFECARRGDHLSDGYFVTFWRLLLKYPEIMAVENSWMQGLKRLHTEIYGVVKAIRPDVKVGWHIMHLQSFSPFYRASMDLGELADYSDFIKSVTYHNCAGGRYQQYIRALTQTIFRDAAPEETYRFIYRILGIEEADWDRLPQAGFSADYVARETRRALSCVAGKCEIWPGIDIDIPSGPRPAEDVGLNERVRDESPKDVADAVRAALDAGAQGIVLSRKYSEMRLANLFAVKKVVETRI